VHENHLISKVVGLHNNGSYTAAKLRAKAHSYATQPRARWHVSILTSQISRIAPDHRRQEACRSSLAQQPMAEPAYCETVGNAEDGGHDPPGSLSSPGFRRAPENRRSSQ
jgi:hypothetical protein